MKAPPTHKGGGVVSRSGHVANSQARLPKLILLTCDGTITSWTSFWELYSSAVHSNVDLSPVQKFSYLKTLLVGVAKEAVDGLSLSAVSYDEAVDILKKRFGNKQKIIDKHNYGPASEHGEYLLSW